jgi:hypothetical protein
VQSGSRWEPLLPTLFGIFANEPTGRVLEYDPSTRSTRVILDGLMFPNGVALSANEDYMLISESGRPSIRRYYLTGPKAGQSDYFVNNLPGIPDGLTIAEDGKVYVAFFGLRSPLLDALLPLPTIRKMLTPFLHFLQLVEPVGLVGLLDTNGDFVETWWDPTGNVTRGITTVVERNGKLYLGSPASNSIGIYDLGM